MTENKNGNLEKVGSPWKRQARSGIEAAAARAPEGKPLWRDDPMPSRQSAPAPPPRPAPSQPPKLRVTELHPFEKGALRGFLTVAFESGMIVNDCKLFQKETGAQWIGWPSEKFVDKATGVAGYKPIVRFADRTVADSFGASVLQALEEFRKEAGAHR